MERFTCWVSLFSLFLPFFLSPLFFPWPFNFGARAKETEGQGGAPESRPLPPNNWPNCVTDYELPLFLTELDVRGLPTLPPRNGESSVLEGTGGKCGRETVEGREGIRTRVIDGASRDIDHLSGCEPRTRMSITTSEQNLSLHPSCPSLFPCSMDFPCLLPRGARSDENHPLNGAAPFSSMEEVRDR
jgi:hypothetical protein